MKRVKLSLPADCLDLLAHFANEERASAQAAGAFEDRRGRITHAAAHLDRMAYWADAASMLAVAIATRDRDEPLDRVERLLGH